MKRILIPLKFIEDPATVYRVVNSLSHDPRTTHLFPIHVIREMEGVSFYSDAYATWEDFRDTESIRVIRGLYPYMRLLRDTHPIIEPIIESGTPEERIYLVADTLDIDVIVIGHRIRTRIQSLFHKNTGSKIAAISRRPVLTYLAEADRQQG